MGVQNAFIYDIIVNLTVHIILYENHGYYTIGQKRILQCMFISNRHNRPNLMKNIVN